ncbi:MAG: hypothetical protein AABZ80_13875 [Gemmatimonadota bacterium]
MAFKKAFILGGAILLAAGCSSSVTSPVAEVEGGAASAAVQAKPTKSAPRVASPTAATTADSTTCRGAYPVSSGFIDTACAIEQ